MVEEVPFVPHQEDGGYEFTRRNDSFGVPVTMESELADSNPHEGAPPRTQSQAVADRGVVVVPFEGMEYEEQQDSALPPAGGDSFSLGSGSSGERKRKASPGSGSSKLTKH